MSMPSSKKRKSKASKLQPSKSKRTEKVQKQQTGKKTFTPKITCFTSKSQNSDSIISPEYKMSGSAGRSTRNSNKDDKEETRSDTEYSSDTPSEKSTCQKGEGEEIHSGVLPCPPLIDIDKFKSLEVSGQMEVLAKVFNDLCKKIVQVDIQLNHDSDGLSTQYSLLQDQCDNTSTNCSKVKESVKEVKKEVSKISSELNTISREQNTYKGIFQRHQHQLDTLNSQVAMLTARSMQNNVTISNLSGNKGKKELCADTVLTFLRNTLQIDVEENELLAAHRVGRWNEKMTRPRLMVVRCKYHLKERIMNNVSNLKGITNDDGQKYYINKQLPEQHVERNRKIKEQIRLQKEKDKHLPVKQKSSIEVINKTVYIDKQPAKEHLPALEIDELFPDEHELDKQMKIKIASSDVVQEEGSTFIGYAVKSSNIQEVRRSNKKVCLLHPGADHIVVAYSIKQHRGYQDDGEHSAGHKLLRVLEGDSKKEDGDMNGDRDDEDAFQQAKSKKGKINAAIFVVRLYGGVHLGGARFKIINKVAEEAFTCLR